MSVQIQRYCLVQIVILLTICVQQLAFGNGLVSDVEPYVGGTMGVSHAGLFDFINTTSADAGLINTKHQANEVLELNYQMGLAYKIRALALRSELALGWQSGVHYGVYSVFNAAKRTSLEANVRPITLMANQYLVLPLNRTRVQPYIMAGVGVAWNRLDMHSSHYNSVGILTNAVYSRGTQQRLAWTAGTGINYMLNDRWELQAGYRYIDYGKINFNLAQIAGVPQSVQSKRFGSNGIMFSLNFHPKSLSS